MDRTTRCPKCGKRMVPVITISGRTDLQCISCDDPAVKWAESPLTAARHKKPRPIEGLGGVFGAMGVPVRRHDSTMTGISDLND
jgi:tRNA(Ile2) C34 agmatinyltransferase TiaS